MKTKIIALDLEGTLISDSYSCDPRPHLFEFLSFCCETFQRVVLFTTVEKEAAFLALEELQSKNLIPQQFLEIVEYIDWQGEFKDLRYIPVSTISEILLVDDDEGYINPEQKEYWIKIKPPYELEQDEELFRIHKKLKSLL